MAILQCLPLFAGVGLFLFGMSILGTALERIAGAKLEGMLERLTSSRFKGVALGTVVTGVIQSSSATTIMAIGLLNAGIIKLGHAVPVIMGANIGTTVTGQILRLGDLGGSNLFLSLLKPSAFGPLLIGIGAAMNLFCKKRKRKDIGYILLGLGMIFFGMNTMETTLSPLKDQVWFKDVFFLFENPFLGIVLGMVMTAVLQSSSASVGILQALSSTGAITFSTAVPIILGQNVGKCVTVILASIGAKKNAKRAVFIDVLSNIIGMLLFFAIIYSYQFIIGFSFWEQPMTRGNIADFHTLFNFITTLSLLPFVDKLVDISKKFVKDKGASRGEAGLDLLDDLLLKTPSLAIEQCYKAVVIMSELAATNYNMAVGLFDSYSQEKMDLIAENEDILDRYQDALASYIVKITSKDIKDSDTKLATEILHAVGDFERIGDHSINIAEVATYNHENGIAFSEEAAAELQMFNEAISEILTITMKAFVTRDILDTLRVEPLEQVIDKMQFDLKEQHVNRLCEGKCDVQAGISFLELLGNYERISDHCSNLALYIVQSHERDYHHFDPHAYLDALHQAPTEEYLATYHYYLDKYHYVLDV